jgi:hypothetical protein
VIFEVFKAVHIQFVVFWLWIRVKMEAARPSKMLVSYHITAQKA